MPLGNPQGYGPPGPPGMMPGGNASPPGGGPDIMQLLMPLLSQPGFLQMLMPILMQLLQGGGGPPPGGPPGAPPGAGPDPLMMQRMARPMMGGGRGVMGGPGGI